MPFGNTPLVIAGGGRYEIGQVVERLDFNEADDGTFIVLHFAHESGRAASIRAPITREAYEAYTARNILI